MDGQTDNVKTVYPPTNTVCGGYNNFLSTTLLHAYVQYVYIMYKRYQIAPSKAVVEVDRQIKVLSMHIQKPLRITKGNNSHRISP